MAGAAGASVRPETLKKGAAQIDRARRTVRGGKAGKVEKREEILKVDVGNRSTAGEDCESDNPVQNSFPARVGRNHKLLRDIGISFEDYLFC